MPEGDRELRREQGADPAEAAEPSGHPLGEAIEAEVSAAREALGEARALLEGVLRSTEGAIEEATGAAPVAEEPSA